MAHPVLKFDIEVHSETIGDDKFNQSVSDLRAREIRNYLISLGVMEYQFVCIARGEFCPIYTRGYRKNETGR
jgi:OmpA-OmpF porin, OOP family